MSSDVSLSATSFSVSSGKQDSIVLDRDIVIVLVLPTLRLIPHLCPMTPTTDSVNVALE